MLALATILLATIELVALHGPDGQQVWINAQQITSIRQPLPADVDQHFPARTRCVVVMVSGKFVATRESCDEVRALINWRASK
jgi:uncharacterized protein YlzI (FlbEa/FlbD family)